MIDIDENFFDDLKVVKNQPSVAESIATEVQDKVIEINKKSSKKNHEKDKPIGPIINKLYKIENEMNDMLFERETIITDCILSLLSKNHIFLYGPPGTGKSKLAEEFCSRINGKYFQWLLNKTTDVSEILGPFSIKKMEQDKFIRVTDGKLPECSIAFVDEIFKGNSPVLNSMLPMLNERIFYNDGKRVKIPLITMFCASNEIPDDEELQALYDRIMFRENVLYVGDIQNKIKMYTSFLNKNKKGIKTTITLDELEILQEYVPKVVVSKKVLNKFQKLIYALEKEGLQISDRRQNECLRVLQANALYNKRNKVVLKDFNVLLNTFWSVPSDIEKIQEKINKISSPYKNKLNKYYVDINDLIDDINGTSDDTEKSQKLIEYKGSIQTAINKIEGILKHCKDKQEVSNDELNILYEDYRNVKQRIKKITIDIIGFDTDASTDTDVNIDKGNNENSNVMPF